MSHKFTSCKASLNHGREHGQQINGLNAHDHPLKKLPSDVRDLKTLDIEILLQSEKNSSL